MRKKMQIFVRIPAKCHISVYVGEQFEIDRGCVNELVAKEVGNHPVGGRQGLCHSPDWTSQAEMTGGRAADSLPAGRAASGSGH
jgi:hypothetical protein